MLASALEEVGSMRELLRVAVDRAFGCVPIRPGVHRGVHVTRKRGTSGRHDPCNQAVFAWLGGVGWAVLDSNQRSWDYK